MQNRLQTSDFGNNQL